MRDYLDPIYYQSTFQGIDQQPNRPGSSVKKSNSVVGGGSVSGNVLGRFLKIGKSKSDAQGYSTSKSRSSSYNIDDLEDEFRLPPSVLNRGPVEKMVHKSNSRKDVSRSHSWIYGSVKLPSDLPFGYGYPSGFDSGNSPSGSDSNSGGSGSPGNGHNNHRNGLSALQIPRCQTVDYYGNGCDCMNDFDFLTPGPDSAKNNRPCEACEFEFALTGGRNGKGKAKSSRSSGASDAGKAFVSSVRKLTWKSLKQAVKKRPSLDNLKRPQDIHLGLRGSSNPYISSSPSGVEIYRNPSGAAMIGSHRNLLDGSMSIPGYYSTASPHSFSADDLNPNYFFPDKKGGCHSTSCTDIYREPPPHVTASVRMRPKRSHQSWQFPNEFDPIPNYQQEEIYHSEWDLRQCMPYDVWVSTTSNIKPRTTLPPPSSCRSKTPTSEISPAHHSRSNANTSLSKSTSALYLSEAKSSSYSSSSSSGKAMSSKSSSSGTLCDATSVKSIGSISKTSNAGSYQKSASESIVKRPSILSADVNAYQLLKAQTKNFSGSNQRGPKAGSPEDDAMSSSSDDLSDNALTSENHMRIAGQKIYLAPNLKVNQSNSSSSSSSSSTLVNGSSKSTSSTSNIGSKSSTSSQPRQTNKNAKPSQRKELHSSLEDEWLDDNASQQRDQQQRSTHVSINRDRNQLPLNKVNKSGGSIEVADKDTRQSTTTTKGLQQQKTKTSQIQKSLPNGNIGFNNGNYANYHENNGARSSSNDNSTAPKQSLSSMTNTIVQVHAIPTSQESNSLYKQESSEILDGEWIEFEEYSFDDRCTNNNSNNVYNGNQQNRGQSLSQESDKTGPGMSTFKSKQVSSSSLQNKSTATATRNPMINSQSSNKTLSNQLQQSQSRPAYIKNGQNKSLQSQIIDSKMNLTNVSANSNSGGKGPGKFGALRRRKSRNGSNPGKLLREVIYEEDMEQEQKNTANSFSHGNEEIMDTKGSSHYNDGSEKGISSRSSQRTNKSTEFAVKIVVSHSSGGSAATEYVKPILKNRERVYDTPIIHGSSSTMNNEYSKSSLYNANNNGNDCESGNNEIYFDSSVSTASKKKVQFDQNKVIVCGGDSGPDSDSNSNEEEFAEKSPYASNNYDKNNGSRTFKQGHSNDSDTEGVGGQDDKLLNGGPHQCFIPQFINNNKESGSLKSTLSNKSAIATNNGNLSGNQSVQREQKTRSSFEEEVARKAASFALSRKRQAEAEVAAKEVAIKEGMTVKPAECYDGHSYASDGVNNLRLDEDQSRFTTNNSAVNTNTTTAFAKRKGNLQVNFKNNPRNSQGTGSVLHGSSSCSSTGTTDLSRSIATGDHDFGSATTITNPTTSSNNANMSNRILRNANNHPNHALASVVMMGRRHVSPMNYDCQDQDHDNDEQPSSHQDIQDPQRIINPNSLLFNDTTRIRLNQSRPSMNETFKLNLSQNGQSARHGTTSSARGVKIKHSNSFRSVGSVPLRPKDPPPPPPTANSNAKQPTGTVPRTISRVQRPTPVATSAGKINQKPTISNQSFTNGHNGNRLPTKSEISLPMGLTTTSNQASYAIKSQNERNSSNDNGNGSRATSANNNNNHNGSSGFEKNTVKTPLGTRTSLNLSNVNVESNKKLQTSTTGSNNNSRSKSLTDRCEALDRVLHGKTSKVNSNKIHQNNKCISSSGKNKQEIHEEIITSSNGTKPQNSNRSGVNNTPKEQPPKGQTLAQAQGNLSNEAMNKGVNNEKSKSLSLLPSSDSQNIEIVTKENSVSEIRIYSASTTEATCNAAANSSNKYPEDRVIYESTKTVINNDTNKAIGPRSTTTKSANVDTIRNANNSQEIHYAATDLFPQNEFLNGRKQFRQPAPLPPIPQQSIVALPARPQSTSVILIVDNNENNNSVSATNTCNNSKIISKNVAEPSSSPLTYSQPLDTLPRHVPAAPSKPLPPPPVNTLLASTMTLNENVIINDIHNDEDCEPLYDDVINHCGSTTDPTTIQGSIGLTNQSSISSSNMKPLLQNIYQENATCGNNRPSQLPPLPPPPKVTTGGHILSSTLPCMACPPSLPPPNLPSKNLSEFHNRPVVINEEERNDGNGFGDLGIMDDNIDDEVDNLYNDISDGSSSSTTQGKSLQSFATSMKGALLNAIKSMDFDRRSTVSSGSNNSTGSGSSSNKRDIISNSKLRFEELSVIYDDTQSLRCVDQDTSRTYYHSNAKMISAPITKSTATTECNSTPETNGNVPQSAFVFSKNTSSLTRPLDNVIEQDEPLSDDQIDNEPLYDDIISMSQLRSGIADLQPDVTDAMNSSDSGAESEDAIPPPLPAQGPPIHLLPKPSTELPLMTFPLLLSKQETTSKPLEINRRNSLGEKQTLDNISISSRKSSVGQISLNKSKTNAQEPHSKNEEDVLTRTRSLLNELNEKLFQLNVGTTDASTSSVSNRSPVHFSTYTGAKAPISSSSESSGVEEDYNSDKNYSLSNGSDAASGSSSSADDNYKLTQVSKLVNETITMARGKFLDSMKSSLLSSANTTTVGLVSTSPTATRLEGNSPNGIEEPIYEEIGDLNRSQSPIYSDAFDAKSIFDGASRNEILSFLESIRDRLTAADSNSSGSQSSSISSKKGSEVERNDSGIGSESSSLVTKDLSIHNIRSEQDDKPGLLRPSVSESHLVLRKLCPDCNDVPIDDEDSGDFVLSKSVEKLSSASSSIPLCNSCGRKRSERKEIITEIHETEMKYGRDLQIITDEFYKPIQIAGLLTKEQLDQIFLNVGELIEISAKLTSMLKLKIQIASTENNDEDLTTVNVGKIFLDIEESMMTTFQTYCTRQANAGALLAQLEKEKELLRIFLRVSQMENTVLRRMNLPAFLMVPVQRVTRYPLLLSRLLKVTPADHFSRDDLQSAHERMEQQLEHMNKSTREVASVKLWRRISIINGNNTPLSRRSNCEVESGMPVTIRKMAIDVLDWANLSDVTCVQDSPLSTFHFNGKPVRGVYGCLLVRGKDLEALSRKMDQEVFFPPTEDLVKEVKLVLVRVKNTRFCLIREPLCLSKCVVSQGENEFQDFIEINEITSKNTYYLQGTDKLATSTWLKSLQCYSNCVGQWRRRRGALANIMMNGMLKNL